MKLYRQASEARRACCSEMAAATLCLRHKFILIYNPVAVCSRFFCLRHETMRAGCKKTRSLAPPAAAYMPVALSYMNIHTRAALIRVRQKKLADSFIRHTHKSAEMLCFPLVCRVFGVTLQTRNANISKANPTSSRWRGISCPGQTLFAAGKSFVVCVFSFFKQKIQTDLVFFFLTDVLEMNQKYAFTIFPNNARHFFRDINWCTWNGDRFYIDATKKVVIKKSLSPYLHFWFTNLFLFLQVIFII